MPPFNVDHVVDSLSWSAPNEEGNLACGFDGEVNKVRLLGWGNKGKFGFRVGRKEIHEEVGGRPFATSAGRSR